MFDWIKGLISPVTDIVKAPIVEWQKRKTLVAENEAKVNELNATAKIKMAEAQVKMAENGQMITADWDQRAQEQAAKSWKDEILMVVLFFPFVAVFYGAMFDKEIIDQIKYAFAVLGGMPEWYIFSIWGIIASAFGLRWIFEPLVNRVSKKSIPDKKPVKPPISK